MLIKFTILMTIDNFIFDVEQIAQAILKQKGVGSHSARSMRVPVEAIEAMLSELHGISQIGGKQHSDLDSSSSVA